MPNKTIYVSDGDAELFRRAQEIAGGNLSAAIVAALRRYVETEEGRAEGLDLITVKVGPGAGRKQRFVGVLVAEGGRSTSTRVEEFRVYRSRTGKYVVHVKRSPDTVSGGPDAEKFATGWRSWVGNWHSEQTWAYTKGEAALTVVETLDAVRELVPPEIYDLVAAAADLPTVEDLDI